MIQLFAFAVAFLVPAVALAQDKPSAATLVFDKVIELVAGVVLVLLTWLVHKVIQYFTAKTHIEVPALTEQTIQDWAAKGVYFAEEQAHKANDATGQKLTGPAKLELALQFVLALTTEYGIDDIAREKIIKYIESHLGEERALAATA